MGRIRQFDVLRAFAVLLVIGCHLDWNPVLWRFGQTGVDLFFCLSGFLVSGLLFREYKKTGRIEVWRFVLRRGFKIYPAYYALVFGTVIFYAIVKTPVSWNTLWPDLFFVQDYKAGSWVHLWTLGVEEQFYLLLPCCLWLLARKQEVDDPFRSLPWICGVIAFACLAARAIHFQAVTPFSHLTHMRPFHLRCDSLSFGVLLSYLHEFRPPSLGVLMYGKGRFLLAVSLMCLLPAVAFDQSAHLMYVFGLTLLYVGYGGILLYTLSCWNGDGRLVRMLGRIGRSSYSIYVWHLPFAWICLSVLQDRLHWSRNPVFGTYVLGSVVVGMGMAQLIEHPALRLRERLFPALASVRTEERPSEQRQTALAFQ